MGPFVVGGVTGGKFVVPMEEDTKLLHLRFHFGDVGESPLGGRDVTGESCVFGWEAEGVPAHGMEDGFELG